jgi:hypothetical protein
VAPLAGALWSTLAHHRRSADELEQRIELQSVTLTVGILLLAGTFWGFLVRYLALAAVPARVLAAAGDRRLGSRTPAGDAELPVRNTLRELPRRAPLEPGRARRPPRRVAPDDQRAGDGRNTTRSLPLALADRALFGTSVEAIFKLDGE